MEPQIVKTSDGKTVILESDGTWQYAETMIAKAEQLEDPGFRDVRWGAGIEQTKLIQKIQPDLEKDNLLGYSGSVSGLNCYIFFDYINNQLVKGRYAFIEEHSNDKDHVYDYLGLKDALAEKYGKPKEEEFWWKRDLWRNDPDHWGLAVSSGDLILFAKWETPITEIYLELSGDNYVISLLAVYKSKKLAHLDKSLTDARKLVGL